MKTATCLLMLVMPRSFAETGIFTFIQAIYLLMFAPGQRGTSAVFLIEDEALSQNIWARVRVKFSAEVSELSRDDPRFAGLCDEIGEVHGPVMEMIRNFTNFHLFEVQPEEGVLVTGFAQAFNVSGPAFELTEHLSKS